ncbi:type-1 restriction enzyme EcoKI specificity protein [mine drainage metagenome]|uniref:Type-1 restriction enzyme EcoKI specificity protein n=1 Tax=mine drainage metagenome TaxID=410659 RepID=A0A1J5RCN1_9ZZZZ
MSLPRFPEYKDSGVAWLGEVPRHWDVRKVRWLCEIKKRISGELGHDVLSITQQGIKIKDLESNDGQISMDYSKYQFVEIGDFAMNHMDLLTGYVDISEVYGVTSPDYRVFSIRDKRASYDKYVLYLFQMGYKNKIFYAFGQGSSQLGRWRLPAEQFNDFFFPLPPLEEQQIIAAFLDRETGKIDALIAEQQRLVELLVEKRQAVISHAVTKGLNQNARIKDSGIEWLGEVPEHWEIGGLTRFIGPVVDYRGRTPTKVDEGIFLVTARNVRDGKIDYEASQEFVDPESAASLLARGKPEIGDLLFTMEAPLGQVALIDRIDIALAQRIVKFRGMPKVIQNNFLLYWFMSAHCQARLETLATGSTALGIKASKLGMIECLVPPLDEQTAIANYIDRETAKLDTLTAEANRAIELLQERRSALISAAVTGKIDVRPLVPSSQSGEGRALETV